MSSPSRARPALVMTAVGAVGAFLVAAGAAMLGGNAAAAGGTLSLTEKVTKMTTLDLGAEGPSLGDRVAFTSTLLDPGGTRIGVGAGECMLYAGRAYEGGRYHCTETLHVNGKGQIFLAGMVGFAARKQAMAVVGGTGRYRGAAGELDAELRSADTYSEVVRFTG